MAKNEKFNEEDGVWRTIGGRRVFIRNGQDLASAMIESGKFKSLRNTYKKQKQKDLEKEEAKEQDKENREEKLKNIEADAEKAYKENIDKNNFAMENAKYGIGTDESTKAYNKAIENHMNELAKDRDDYEYELYKKAKENPDSIDPMTENSTDWEALEEKYKDRYDKENGNKDIRIENKDGELTGYTNGERIEYFHSGDTGLTASVYSTDNGKLSGQSFSIPKEYQGDKLEEYSLKEVERLKNDKEAYETRQKEGLDKFIQKSTNPFYPDNEYSKEDLDRMAENGIKPMDNSYSGRGWKGVNSDKHLSTSEQAKAITNAMKEKYSDVKISRKSDVYSGGSSIDFNIMSSDKDMYISDADIDKLGDEQLFNTDITRGYGFERWANDNIENYKTEHTYSVDDVKKYAKETLNNIKNHENQNVRGNEWYLSDYGKKVVSDLNKEANSYTYDDSDSMTDYFNHGTYMNVSIGKWDKPYQVNQKATNETKKNTIADAITRNNELSKKLASEGRTYDDHLIEKRTNGKYKTMDEVLDTAERMSTNETMNKAIREKASKQSNGEWKQEAGGVTIRETNEGTNYIQGVRKGDGSHEYTRTDYDKNGNELSSKTYKSLEDAKNSKSTNETINNSLREKAGSKYYEGTKRWGFGYANDDNIPVYQNKIDYSGDFTHANLSKVSDDDLVKIANKQNELYNEATSRQVGDRRTYNGKKDQIFKNTDTLRYGNGLDVVSKEMEQRGLKPDNQITNALKEKAYKKYLKEHPGSKISFEQFKDMRK